MENYEVYGELVKPFFAPPDWLFGPVWGVLYLLIFISFGFVFWRAWQNKLPQKVVWPFVLNLVFNGIFTAIQFGLQNYLLASVDIVLVLLTIVWCMWIVWPYYKWVTYLQIPYLLWVSFATVLQISITVLN